MVVRRMALANVQARKNGRQTPLKTAALNGSAGATFAFTGVCSGMSR